MSTYPKRLVTLREAAEMLGIHRATAYRLARKGEFPVPLVQVGSSKKVAVDQLDHLIRTGSPIE